MFIRPLQNSNFAMDRVSTASCFDEFVYIVCLRNFGVGVFNRTFHDASNLMYIDLNLKTCFRYHRWFQQIIASTNTVTVSFFQFNYSGVTCRRAMLKSQVATWCWNNSWYDVLSCLDLKCAVVFAPFPTSNMFLSKFSKSKCTKNNLRRTMRFLFCRLVSKQLI